MVSCLQQCRMRPWHMTVTNTCGLMFTTLYDKTMTHNSHKHTSSHVYNTVGWDHDTWQSQTDMVSCLQHCRMKPLTHDSHNNNLTRWNQGMLQSQHGPSGFFLYFTSNRRRDRMVWNVIACKVHCSFLFKCFF